ncbi:MAG: hypothetical protein KFF68_07835 [Desulfosarcina sp.]|nr:hypothetical protein [Desulfosarcina sp.]
MSRSTIGRGIEKGARNAGVLYAVWFPASRYHRKTESIKHPPPPPPLLLLDGMGGIAACRGGFEAAVVAVDGACICYDDQPERVQGARGQCGQGNGDALIGRG